MEPDEIHEPQNDDLSDRLIDFEADNFMDLVEEFVNLKSINNQWAEFVYQKFEDSLPDYEPPEGEL